MVEAGGSGGFWDLDFWNSASNLIGVVILGMAVPIVKWLLKKKSDRDSANREREDEHIAKICKKFTDPMMDKLNKIDSKVEVMEGIFKSNFDIDPDTGELEPKKRPRGRRYDFGSKHFGLGRTDKGGGIGDQSPPEDYDLR